MPASPQAYAGAMLDTSVWVAVLEGEAVADELENAQGELDALSSPIVLAELASLAARGRMDGPSPLDIVTQTSRVEEMTIEDAIEGGKLHGRLRREGHGKIGLGDCIIYATARRLHALLITCDMDLSGQPNVHCLKQKKRRREGPAET